MESLTDNIIAPDVIPLKSWDELFIIEGGLVNRGGGLSPIGKPIQSPNFISGVSGWRINSNGDAEFNSGIFRGNVVLGGTVRTVDSADEIQPAIDDVSAGGGGTIYIAPGIYLMTSFIDIPSNVYLIGASRSAVILDFQGGAMGVRSIGSVGTHIANILVKDITIIDSSITGLKLQYNDVSQIDGVDVFDCNIGIELDNTDSVLTGGMGVLCEDNNTNFKITNSVAFSIYYSAMINSLTGHGLEISNCSSATVFDSAMEGNTGDGINLTTCFNIAFISVVADGNGGQGIEMVSACNDLQFIVRASSNGSDGIKITATSDRNQIIAGTFGSNGGFGVNIAAATCDNNIISTSTFTSNVGGTINNSGTTTSITGNIGVSDTGRTFSSAVTSTSFIPSSSTVPTNGMYLPAANTLGWAVNSTGELQLSSTALAPISDAGVALGTTTLAFNGLHLNTATAINWENGNATVTHSTGLLTSNVDFVVPDEAYGSGWNASLEVPTKNAVYDKIETLTASPILEAIVTVSSAEILALHTTPVQLLAAPGAGKIHIILQITYFLDFGGTAYALGGDVNPRYTGDTEKLISEIGTTQIRATADNVAVRAQGASNATNVDATDGVNAVVELALPSGVAYTTGNGILKCFILYRTITL